MSERMPSRTIQLLLFLMIGLQILFLTELMIEKNFLDFAERYRGGWLLAQLFATAVLFVDMVVRFDSINPRIRAFHIIGVAACAMGWCFQFFVHYLDSALLN